MSACEVPIPQIIVWKGPAATRAAPPGATTISGSGQINVDFIIENFIGPTGVPAQIGLRAQRRFIGPVPPVGNTYSFD